MATRVNFLRILLAAILLDVADMAESFELAWMVRCQEERGLYRGGGTGCFKGARESTWTGAVLSHTAGVVTQGGWTRGVWREEKERNIPI